MGLALILLGLFLPRGWYDALPRDPRLPIPPVNGVTLLQAALVLDGLAWRSPAASGGPAGGVPQALVRLAAQD